jgi:ubiquitin C-terminal hydrolase
MDDLMTKLPSYKIDNKDADKNYKTNIQDFFKDLISGEKAQLNYGITDATHDEKPKKNNYYNLYKVFYGNRFSKIKFGEEQDAEEFLNYLLNYLSEIPTILGDGTAKYISNGFKLDNTSFTFTTEEKIECKDGIRVGEKNTTQIITNSILNLPIVDSKVKKLVDAIKNYQSEEILLPANYVSKCINKTNPTAVNGPASKTLTIKIPKENKYLIIQLKLFDNTLQKIKNKINIENILLIDGKTYNLSGFIEHQEKTIANGHYVFYKVLADGSGILYDDDNVSYTDKKTIDKFLNKTSANLPYILLYERV